MGYRVKKRGLEKAIFTREIGKIFHDHPTQSIYASNEPLRKWMLRMSAQNTAYGVAKWGIREEQHFMLHKDNRWAIDTTTLRDAGNDWMLDLEVRRQRIALLKEQTGVETPLLCCKDCSSPRKCETTAAGT